MVAQNRNGNNNLGRGDGIFVSISGALPAVLLVRALEVGEEMELQLFVYKGLRGLPSNVTTNAHAPASRDFERSKALFIILLARSPKPFDDWILGYLDRARDLRMPITLYLWDTGGKDPKHYFSPPNLVEAVHCTRTISGLDGFGEVFRGDLRFLKGVGATG